MLEREPLCSDCDSTVAAHSLSRCVCVCVWLCGIVNASIMRHQITIHVTHHNQNEALKRRRNYAIYRTNHTPFRHSDENIFGKTTMCANTKWINAKQRWWKRNLRWWLNAIDFEMKHENGQWTNEIFQYSTQISLKHIVYLPKGNFYSTKRE